MDIPIVDPTNLKIERKYLVIHTKRAEIVTLFQGEHPERAISKKAGLNDDWTSESQVILVPTDRTPYKIIKKQPSTVRYRYVQVAPARRNVNMHYAAFPNGGLKLLHTTVQI